MAEASSAAAAPLLRGLPDEIALWEILIRLPPKSLLRCRAVCPDWRRATSNREFLVAHHGRQPCLPLVYDFKVDLDVSYIDIAPFDHRAQAGAGVAAADQLQPVARLGDPFYHLEASCDGLVVLRDRISEYSVCNPANRRYAPLPQIYGFVILGMYPHHNTGEYRLLLCSEPVYEGGELVDDNACRVFALGSCQPPRNIVIGCPDGVRYAHVPGVIEPRVPVLFHGNLHWHLDQPENGSNLIMVFDTTDELFRQMHSPVHGGTGLLFDMDGMLAMYSFDDATKIIDIWVLQDYESEVWAFKCKVQLPVEEIREQFQKFDNNWDVTVTCTDDDVLILLQFDNFDGRLLHIDINGKLVAGFRRTLLVPTPLRLKQTLVPHTFFPTPEGYVVNDSPFI